MAQITISPESVDSSGKVIVGEAALDGTNPTPINCAGKLRGIVSVTLTLKSALSPGVLGSLLTYNVPAATPALVNVYAWKVTNTTTTTLIASTDTTTFSYMIVGY